MPAPLVTVVVLTYDHARSVARALDSVLSQRTRFPFVVLVAEDASRDGTQAVLKTYEKKHPGLVTLRLRATNLGAVRNLREALAEITSPYWAFVEGDDEWCDDEKLQVQVDALEAHPHAMICGHDTLYRDLQTGEERSFIRGHLGAAPRQWSTLEDGFRVHPSARLYRNLGGYADVPERMFYDTACSMLHLARGPMIYIDRVMSIYNVTGMGMWSGASRHERELLGLRVTMAKNAFFEYRFDDLLSPPSRTLRRLKAVLGRRAGWRVYWWLRRISAWIAAWAPRR